MTTLGYDHPLYRLPFDHRGSFQTKLFGWSGPLTTAQTAEIAAAKQVVYDALKQRFVSASPSGKPESWWTNSSALRFSRAPGSRVHERLPGGEERAGRIRL